MPVVFPVLVPFLILLAALAALALHQTENLWLRPLLESLTHPKGSFLKRVALAPVASLISGILYVEKHVRAVLSHYAAAHFPMAIHWFHGHTHRVNAQAHEIAAVPNDTADALGVLRHVTMPRAISAKVAPVKAQAAVAERTSRRSISLTRREATERRRSIDRLNRKTGLLAGILLGIDVLVRGRHAARHHHDHAQTIPRIRDRDIPRLKAHDRAHGNELADHRTRIKRLERALGLGLLAGLVYRVLARVAPWLFCRNWKKIGPRVCGMHAGLLNLLLGAGVGMFAFAELCRLVETVGVVAARVLPKLIAPLAVAGAALCDGEHSAAAALPLQTTALPPVDNPLTF